MGSLPKSFVVAGVLIIGVLGIILFQPPHHLCDAKLEVFRNSQAGNIFPGDKKNRPRQPALRGFVESCKMGNSPGACFDYLNALRGLVRDLSQMPQECASRAGEISEVRATLQEAVALMAKLAWGEGVPTTDSEVAPATWFETSDVALFCRVKEQSIQLYGPESWTGWMQAVFAELPGDLPRFEGDKCLNCDSRRKAKEFLSIEELRKNSLFGVRCDLLR